ncbi:TadE/TadG family type IV pilus assembly protein [Aestuariivita boseongensis]|uniref:TadE/TadG family type IV pilus assembly protein n=1 Tax=Aestuariivita boseongensis TaxID=1470562 RepID=UPI000AEBFA7F|nr:pilus assembly protein [Aestuariivita boseongensis]
MTILTSLKNALKRFRRDTSGSATIEFAIIMPMLFWTYASTYVFFDGFRQNTINLRAAYTIGDMISRETQALTPAYIDSMYNMTQLLTRTDSPMSLRITVIRWDAEDNQFYLDWSQARGTVTALTQGDMANIATRLPVMPDEERVILVETWNTWEPVLQVGLGERSMDNFIFTRPRFAPQVVFDGGA